MTVPHHSEPAREAVAWPSEVTEAQINSACLSYRHDFGIMTADQRRQVQFEAKEWLHAWRKEFEPLAPALKVSASPAPAAGGLEAVLTMALQALEHSKPVMAHYEEPVARHKAALEAVKGALASPAATSAETQGREGWFKVGAKRWARDGATVQEKRGPIGTAHRVTFDDGRTFNAASLEEAKAYADDRLARLGRNDGSDHV